MKNLKEQIETILIQMMPAAPSYPTANLQEQDHKSRIAALGKASNRIVDLIVLRDAFVIGSNWALTYHTGYAEHVVPEAASVNHEKVEQRKRAEESL